MEVSASMKKKQVISVALAVMAGTIAISLAGCGTSDPVHDVPWYKSHDKQRTAMVTKCKADPGELGNTPNCVNAQKAQSELLLACTYASDKVTLSVDT